MVTSAQARPDAAGGLAPAFAAARPRIGLIVLLLILAGLAWWSTLDRMRGMDAGPGTDLGTLGWFVGVWIVMMAAMMLPSVAPTVALYSRMTRSREPVAPLVLRLIGPDGAEQQVAVKQDGAALAVFPSGELRRGTHLLSWRVVSADGHPIGGTVIFSVGDATEGGPPPEHAADAAQIAASSSTSST